MDFVEKTIEFNNIGDNEIGYNKKKLCFYIGMILEESAETIEAFLNERQDDELYALHATMERLGKKFKNGDYAHLSDGADIIKVVDGAADTAVVSVGAIMQAGFNPVTVLDEVAESNLSKFIIDEDTGDMYAIKNDQGKIQKGPDYFEPDLTKPTHTAGTHLIHPSLYKIQ